MRNMKPVAEILNMENAKSSFEIINVVLRALSAIDDRLIDHGERVAYIADAILAYVPTKAAINREQLFILSILHDIGAYKTEEIDNMVHFETNDSLSHAVYGYLFLKCFTELKDYAEAVLYHHTDYDQLQAINTAYIDYAQLIYLADRIDILACNQMDVLKIACYAETKFNPVFVQAFLQAEQKQQVSTQLQTGAYRQSIGQFIHQLHFTPSEILDFLNLLVYSMDFRSPYTISHTANTTAISVQLGTLFGLSEAELQTLYYGAVFHDLGKVAIPVSILEKNGALTREEMQIMRTHVEKTEAILRGIVDDKVCDIAIRHHEKLNGTGYPRGLKAEDLTQLQRIVAVADILSALSGRRSYKDKFPKEKIVLILTEMKNKEQLCPIVCDTAMEHYEQIMVNTLLVEGEMLKLYHQINHDFNELMYNYHQLGYFIPASVVQQTSPAANE